MKTNDNRKSKLCTAELARRGDLATAVTPLWLRKGGPFSPCWAVRAVAARVVPMAHLPGVTKTPAAKGPATIPIIPGVAILARLGIARRLLVTRQRKLKSLKQLKWKPEIWCENCRGLGVRETSWLNRKLLLLFWRQCHSGAMICQRSALVSE